MISFDEALAAVVALARPLGSERIALEAAKDRILAEPVFARMASPPADVSMMDGYAVRDADLLSLPARLAVTGESRPGARFEGALDAGCCARIFTGAPVSPGADRILIQEVVRREGDVAVLDAAPGEATHIRRRGSDFAEGDLLVEAGRTLGYRALVAAAGGDNDEVCVWARPRVTFLGTGDELVAPGSARTSPGAIPESLGLGISALAEAHGATIVARHRLLDDLPLLRRHAAEAVRTSDVVVVTGGASVGERDFAKAMFAEEGLDLVFSKVAMKPGKPVWLGRCGGALVIGLPGNPGSALVTARLLFVPLLDGLSGRNPLASMRWRDLPLSSPLAAGGDRETFARARWNGAAAEPVDNQDSGAQRALAEADLLIRRDAGSPALEAGALVQALDF